MHIIGVDPGKHGALAHIHDGVLSEVISFNENIEYCRVTTFNMCITSPVYFIEKVTASPHMGVVSAFTFGKWAEAVESAAVLTGCEVHVIRPIVWQNSIGVFSAGDKKVLYAHAQKLFPEEHAKKVFNRESSDAVLIAYYGWKFKTFERKK